MRFIFMKLPKKAQKLILVVNHANIIARIFALWSVLLLQENIFTLISFCDYFLMFMSGIY